MADYCTQTDIEENLKGVTFSGATSVTVTALSNIITQESQVVDQHIQGRYDIPVTDSDALIFLKKICIDLVIYRVTKILQPKSHDPLPDPRAKQVISYGSAYREAMRMLKEIQKGVMQVPNSDPIAVKLFGSTLVDDDISSVVEKDTEQW